MSAPNLEKPDIDSFRPLRISVKTTPRLAMNMEKREHEKTDEVDNMLIFLGGLGSAKELRLDSSLRYSKMLSKSKVPLPKRLSEKLYLVGLQVLTLTMDHNHEDVANLPL
ncbi:hypothetical protein E2562_022657 [Oryza meyeriana var. granulata]|uniref:Uncharacterized protein n=1 Tax=Oryza meyeriana var. granulata TaxID=110450 RepID=A0A6G1E073_9ORYZ|nr:hypothetical protein E2562_022657 [Oryza meyeriana var. granulata]